MMCPTLRKVEKQVVSFNPHDPMHIKAFETMCLGKDGVLSQHPYLRFELEEGFVDVRSMMLYKVGQAWVRLTQSVEEDRSV